MAFSSEEGDLELRDAVLQLLDESGALSKIKADLRARVFKLLYDSNQLKNKLPPPRVAQFADQDEGRLALSLVRDLLQRLDLNFTLSVFEAEAESKNNFLSRNETAAKLDIGTSSKDPLISSLVDAALNPITRRASMIQNNADVQTMFAEQSFFAQLDNEDNKPKVGAGTTNERFSGFKRESEKSEKFESKLESETIVSPPRSPEKATEGNADEPEASHNKTSLVANVQSNNKLSPLKPLSSLKDLPQLQAPSKLPSLKRPPPPDHVKALDGDSGDDVESLGDDLLSSLGDSSTNEASTSNAEIPNCDYVEKIA